LATIGGGAIGAICSGGSVTIGDGDSVAIGNGGGNLDADALRVGDDMDVLLGNRTTVVLAGDDLGHLAQAQALAEATPSARATLAWLAASAWAQATVEAQAATRSVVGWTTTPYVRVT
jgi:hypothetical protein